MMDTHELAWAAGFFDGEGHIAAAKHGRQLHFSVSQKDRRALDRFARAVGFGKIYGPYGNGARGYIYSYQAATHEKVQAVVGMLWRWLGPVKREQAAQALKAHAAFPGRRLGNTAKVYHLGHSLSDAYVTRDGLHRQCRVCSRRRQQEYHARKFPISRGGKT
jgi:hypothetical protein